MMINQYEKQSHVLGVPIAISGSLRISPYTYERSPEVTSCRCRRFHQPGCAKYKIYF
jgi:hypothetical protein